MFSVGRAWSSRCFFLLIKVKVPEQATEIEMIAFDSEELKALESVEDMNELQDVPLD